METERIALSQRERDRLKVLYEVKEKHLTQVAAAKRLKVTDRHVRRMLLRLRQRGDHSLVHGLRGQASNRKLPARLQQKILARLQQRYADFGPTLAAEHLAQERFSVSRETLRKWMTKAALWRPRSQRVKAVHVWRERRASFGELVMQDSSPFRWLEERGPACQLIALIDDATSRIWGRFTEHDTTEENLRTLEGWVRRYGRPLAHYTDKASIFRKAGPQPLAEQLRGDPLRTQFGRALHELGIEWILGASDLVQVQKAATKMLAGSLADSDMAAVLSFSGVNSGMTRDRAKLQDAIMQVKVQNLYRHNGRECADIDYYQADLIRNEHNDQAFQAAVDDALNCGHLDMRPLAEHMARAAASRALAIGDQDVRVSLGFVRDVVRRMASLPGQRNLILMSPGFLTVVPEAMSDKSQILDLAAQSNVTISALDARGLYTTELDASEQGAHTTRALMTGDQGQRHSDAMSLNEDVMAEFADGTGGTFFHNSNDLEGRFKSLTQAPEYVYLLEFSLEKVKPDGTYHHLKVKADNGGLKLQTRRGYFAPKPDKASTVLTAPTLQAAPELTATPQSPASPQATAASQSPTTPGASVAPQAKGAEKKPKSKSLFWDPPDIDAPLRSDSSSPPCLLSYVLEQSGGRADELVTNLQNFTAEEKIEYQSVGHMAHLLEGGVGTFDYIVVFEQRLEGLAVQESRTQERGSGAFPASTQDIGLPEMALIFLPSFQGDYEMKCEGAAEWNGQPTWVVHFQQRKDRPSHTASFSVKGVGYPAKLKGRAWIARGSSPDSGEIMHLETGLMEAIPAANVRQKYLSIDYAPVQFRTQNVRVWLPQAVDACGDFGDHRTVIHHTFTNFMLFSVQTDQAIKKPKDR